MLKSWKEGLSLVFSMRKYWLVFAAILTILLPLYAVLTDIVVLGNPIILNPAINTAGAALILAIAFLSSLGFTIAAYQVFEQHTFSKKSAAGSMFGAGAGGSVLAAFATACTVCQPIWLVWLGFGSASAFLIDYGNYIAMASIAILLYSINSGLRAITEGCQTNKTAKKG